MPNRLARETSPYLRQHAGNPVDWYPWGPEALERSREENKPILLSIGYAACHWCHVMEHESFEDEATAKLMNERFVNIKVDREERPDLDQIYMQAVQTMTGHGGWPMTVFLTPEGMPFYGGTYFPPEDRHGMPAFRRVLTALADAYEKKPDDIAKTVAQMRQLYAASGEALAASGSVTPALLERAYRGLAQRYDVRHGGFEGAPKFPQAMALDFLLRHWRRTGTAYALEMASASYRAMVRGGIYDQLGGGFHRYTVDAIWLVPHFEKMLYDNALLARLGVHLWQATGDADARRAAEETIEWVAREMTSPAGGFYSSLDADSEGEEGTFYVWSAAEIDTLLGDDARVVKAWYGVTPGGNFEGKNILSVPHDIGAVVARTGVDEATVLEAVSRAKEILFQARAGRVRPGLDDKALASWNALMLRAIADAARAFGRRDFTDMAVRNGEFIFRELVRDGRVMRTHINGETRLNGYLEDHASVGLAALSLYELTFDREWLERALVIADGMVVWFWDEESRAFHDTAADHEQLVTRPRDVTDNATPSGTSLAVELLVRLAGLGQDEAARARATWVLETLAEPAARHGIAFGHLLGAMDMAAHGMVEVALVGDPASAEFRALAGEVNRRYVPALLMVGGQPEEAAGIALLEGRPMRDGRATAYVCRNHACDAPTTDAAELGAQLDASSGRSVSAHA